MLAGIVTDQLQGIVGLDGSTEIESTSIEQRAPTVLGLLGAQVIANLLLERAVDVIHVMTDEHELGWYGGIRLELIAPLAGHLLVVEQRL